MSVYTPNVKKLIALYAIALLRAVSSESAIGVSWSVVLGSDQADALCSLLERLSEMRMDFLQDRRKHPALPLLGLTILYVAANPRNHDAGLAVELARTSTLAPSSRSMGGFSTTCSPCLTPSLSSTSVPKSRISVSC